MIRERAFKRGVGCSGIVVYVSCLSRGDGLMASVCRGPGRYDDEESLCNAWHFLVVGRALSIGASQPDRFCCVVEFRPCGSHVSTCLRAYVCERPRRILGRLRCARCYWVVLLALSPSKARTSPSLTAA